MPEGILQQAQQTQMQQALAGYQQRKDQQFMGGLLRSAMDVGDFDISGAIPSYEPSMMDFMNKDAALSSYIRHKNGRVSDAEIIQFTNQYKQAKNVRNELLSQKLGKLSARGYSDHKIQSMVKNNPQLYSSIVDRISSLEAMGDEGVANAALMRSKYLPQQTWGEWYSEKLYDEPLTTSAYSIATVSGVAAGAAGISPKILGWLGKNPEAQKTFDDLTKDRLEKRTDGNWYRTDKRGRVSKVPKTNTKLLGEIKRLEKAVTPSWKNFAKNQILSRGGMGFGGYAAAHFLPSVGRGIGGEAGETVGEFAQAGAYGTSAGIRLKGMAEQAIGSKVPEKMTKQKAAKLFSKMKGPMGRWFRNVIAKRVAAGPANFSWGQLVMSAIDVALLASALKQGFTGDERDRSGQKAYKPIYSYQRNT